MSLSETTNVAIVTGASRGFGRALTTALLERGWTVVVVAHRGGTAMMLKFEAQGVDRVELRRFAARVLDAL